MYSVAVLGFVSFVLALILTPVCRNLFRRLGVLDQPDGLRKLHASPVPRIGGVPLMAAYIGAFAVLLVSPLAATRLVGTGLPIAWKILPGAALVFAIGLLDDLRGLKPWHKFAGQVVAAAVAIWAGVHVTSVGGVLMPPWLSLPITLVWLVGCSNAFNLIDGVDGLAAGAGFFATVTILLGALLTKNVALSLAMVPLAGALLGFLRYNFNPASIFLGDSGSLTIGFLLGCYGALWSEKSVTLVALTVPLLAVSIPLLDVLLSITRRYLRNRPIFEADRGHIHHKLLDRGLSPKGAVLTIYAFCGAVALLSLVASSLRNQFSGLIVIVFCAAAWMAIQQLGYTEFAMAGRLFLQGGFRRIIDFETRLVDFEKALARAGGVEECWIRIRSGSREFGFQGVRMNFEGLVFEDFERQSFQAGDARRLWELRIPLDEARNVNFFHDMRIETSSMVLSAFATAVEHGMRTCIERRFQEDAAAPPAAEVVKMPPIVKRYYAAAAAAGAGTGNGS